MASVIISGETTRDVPEVGKMLDDLLHGKISLRRFIKFLDDNNLETKVRCINEDINPSALVDFVGDTISTVFSIPKKSESEDVEDINDEETEDDERENHDEFWKKTNEEYVEHVKDTVEFAKRLIDDYGDSEEDDIDHAKAVKLFHSMMILGRTYRKRAIKGDREYNIPTFTPENILKFIDSIIGLPTDKIEAALERGKSNYYKMKIYKDFDDFVTSMRDIYGIEDVWNPPKEVPEWFESVRNMQYRKFYPTEDILIDESEWKEFEKWKEEKKDKEDIYTKSNKLFREILKIKPNLDIYEMAGINELAMRGCVKGLEECLNCLKKSKDSSINKTIMKYNVGKSCDEGCTCFDKKNDNEESFEDQCRHIVNDVINKFYPIITGKALKYFEDKYKSNDKIFMDQLKTLYNAVESARNMWLTCFIDVDLEYDEIICNPIQNTKNAIEEKLLNAVSTKPDSKESSDKKSSTSKKSSSNSVKKIKVSVNKATEKSKTNTKLKDFEKYLNYIFLNSVVEHDARDLLISYAANKNEKCKELYYYLVDLKKKNKSVKLIKYLDDKTGNVDISFTEIEG